MGSALGPLPANIFLVVLEASVISNLNDKVKLLKRFFDDIYCLARSEYTGNVLFALTSFHRYITFTIENEKDNTIPFLDTLMRRKLRKVGNTVYRKKTCTAFYVY